MKEKLVDRISYIADKEGITIFQLERTVGASKGTLYKAIQGGKDIQSKWLTVIARLYPHYSTRWILTGDAPILSEKSLDFQIDARGKGNVVTNRHGNSISIPASNRSIEGSNNNEFLERFILSKEEKIKELTTALKEAQRTIRTLSERI